jgi:endonuclease/exonuclease/phosphatase family metal-dependent hydrolase
VFTGAKLTGRRAAIVNATLRGLAMGYPIAVSLFIVALRLIGERWWGTTIALYIPRLPFALPLLPLTAAIIWLGPGRLLWTQVVATSLLLVLLGFNFAWPGRATPGAFHLRVVSCNINGGTLGAETILRSLLPTDADVILLQEVDPGSYGQLHAQVPGYTVRESGQFWLASRFPVEEVMEPPKMINMGFLRSQRFVRYRLMTPAGPLLLYNVHPISPRDGLEGVRGNGFRRQILRGNLFSPRARTLVTQNTALRLVQLAAVAADARSARVPVLIAGDTNLPGLSWAYAHLLGDYRDGFSEAGTGFGYSFPSPQHPWMRIDRIMADRHFRFLGFQVIDRYVSDHFAIRADLELPQATGHQLRAQSSGHSG